jgi:hypothetical protein
MNSNALNDQLGGMSASLGDLGMRSSGRLSIIRKAAGGSKNAEEQMTTEETQSQYDRDDEYTIRKGKAHNQIEVVDDQVILMSAKKIADPTTLFKEFREEMSSEEARKGKKKNRSGVVQLPDPFGLANHRKIDVADASTPVKFLMLYENHLLAIAARHIYVYDKDSGA